MPVRPLPLEVVALITTEVRLACADFQARRDAGTSIALVCRAWRPLGESVCWHSLDLSEPGLAHETAERFKDAPHLAQSVRDLACGTEIDLDQPLKTFEDRAATDDLLTLWRLCTRVKRLELRQEQWVDTSHFFAYLSPSDSLRNFAFETRRVHASRRLLRALAAFPRLATLELDLPETSPWETSVEEIQSAPRLPVHFLGCRTTRQQLDAPEPARLIPLRHLFNLIHPDTLCSISLTHSMVGPSLFHQFFTFPNLDILALSVFRQPPLPIIEQALDLLAEERHARPFCVVSSWSADKARPAISLRDQHTLEDILAALPQGKFRLALGGMYVNAATLPPERLTQRFNDLHSTFVVGVKVAGQDKLETVFFGRDSAQSAWFIASRMKYFVI
ncbi:hypothetical protein JCM6882_000411 [Rhodosporidiobolus microsporus]